MARHFDLYRVTETSEASADYFNEVHEDVDLRLHAVEQRASAWDEVVATFTDIGLQRLEQALTPLYEQVANVGGSISELLQAGTFFNASSLSASTPGLGNKTFVVDASVRANFSPSYYLTAFKANDSSVFMSGYLVSYNRNTGVLTLRVDRFGGTAEIAAWTIAPTVEISALQGAYQARDAAIAAYQTALGYATQAATSQNLAASAQAAAIAGRDQALTAATNAYSYATQAASARDNALIQAQNASTSASQATSIQANVQAIADNILNTYLGQFSTDPTGGKNGAPLQPGMLYYNTTNSETRVYTGSSWVGLNSTQYLSTAGGTLTGALSLAGDPSQDNQASNKGYVDSTALAISIALG